MHMRMFWLTVQYSTVFRLTVQYDFDFSHPFLFLLIFKETSKDPALSHGYVEALCPESGSIPLAERSSEFDSSVEAIRLLPSGIVKMHSNAVFLFRCRLTLCRHVSEHISSRLCSDGQPVGTVRHATTWPFHRFPSNLGERVPCLRTIMGAVILLSQLFLSSHAPF